MDPHLYKVLHLAGVVGLFTALGSFITADENGSRKFAGILHGISLLLILVAGFGLLAKLYDNNFAWWVIVKLVIWILLGGILGLAKRQVLPRPALFTIVLTLGTAAAWLGIYGKFM